jgi:hypothetical protein
LKIGAALLARRNGALPGVERLLADARALAAQACRAPCRLELCLSAEGNLACAYLWGESLRAFAPTAAAAGWSGLQRLAMLASRPGASAGQAAPWRYVVATDIEPGWEHEFNDWYDSEHLPGLAAVPGTALACRLRSLGGGPRYHACYRVASPQVLEHPAWLDVRHTAWSSRVRPHFVSTERTMFRVLAEETVAAPAEGGGP